MDPRHLTRIYIVQKLFEKHFSSDKGCGSLFEDTEYIKDEYAKVDKNRANDLTDKIDEMTGVLDKIIAFYAPEWPVEQIVKTDLEILRLSIYEGFVERLVPEKVSINEAIDLARQFGGESSRKFVSGVLGSLYEDKNSDKIRRYVKKA